MEAVTTLRDETRELLKHRPASITIEQIANELGVSGAWVNAFARGSIRNPGVVTIETLNRYLKKMTKAIR